MRQTGNVLVEMFVLAVGAITWSNKIQNCIALNTVESEFVFINETINELTFLVKLSKEIVIKTILRMSELVDNQGAIEFKKIK